MEMFFYFWRGVRIKKKKELYDLHKKHRHTHGHRTLQSPVAVCMTMIKRSYEKEMICIFS